MDVNLILFKKNGSQKVIPLPSKVTVIGRHDCDIQIPLLSVSRRHCQISLNNESLKIRDLGSRNGTYLNGQRIEEAITRAGDKLTIGPLTFGLQIDGQPKEFALPAPAIKKPSSPTPAVRHPQAESGAEKPAPKGPAAKAAPPSKKEADSVEELTLDEQPDLSEKPDELPDLDLDEVDDSFLDDLEKL
jgi:pSer/pThr/pTyr-binding forkhead associated (FHA) protein